MKEDKIKFYIKKKGNTPTSSQEHVISEEVKAFRRAAIKMNAGDSITINSVQRHKIQNFLRFRGLGAYFKTRTLSKKKDIIVMYCIKKIYKHQLA